MADAILEAANTALRDAVAARTAAKSIQGGEIMDAAMRAAGIAQPGFGIPASAFAKPISEWSAARTVSGGWDGIAQHVAPLQPMELRTQSQPPRFIEITEVDHIPTWLAVRHIVRFYNHEPSDGTMYLDVDRVPHTLRIVGTAEVFAARLNGGA